MYTLLLIVCCLTLLALSSIKLLVLLYRNNICQEFVFNNLEYNEHQNDETTTDICSYSDLLLTVKQISFQVNWVNTQAFLINWVLAFSIGYHFFYTRGIFSNWVFLQNKLL